MNQPTMTNEQFALWITLQTRSTFSLKEAKDILDWLNNSKSTANAVKPTEPITPKKK